MYGHSNMILQLAEFISGFTTPLVFQVHMNLIVQHIFVIFWVQDNLNMINDYLFELDRTACKRPYTVFCYLQEFTWPNISPNFLLFWSQGKICIISQKQISGIPTHARYTYTIKLPLSDVMFYKHDLVLVFVYLIVTSTTVFVE